MANKNFELRFCVGEKNKATSSVWRIWGHDPLKKSDANSNVYFSYRSIAGEIKISFHESGQINYSFTSQYIEKKELENQLRHIEQWEINTKKPVFRIIVPHSELKEPKFKFHKKTKFIPAPDEGYASHLYIYITDINIKASLPNDFNLLFEQQLANKNWLSIVWRQEEVTENNKNLYIEAKKQVNKIANYYSGKAKDLRGYLFLNGSSGPNGFVDISF